YFGERRISALAELHSLWRVHEYLPGLSAQWWLQLSLDGAGANWLDPRPQPRSQEVLQPAACVQPVRQLRRRLSGEDRYPPSTAHVAARDRCRRALAVDQAREHGPDEPAHASPVAVPPGRLD